MGLSLVLGWGFPAQAAEGKCYKRNYTFNFLAENDLWGSGSDKHFTHGTRLSLRRLQRKRAGFAICDTFELDLGIIGPESYAEDVQKWVHQNISNSPQPEV